MFRDSRLVRLKRWGCGVVGVLAIVFGLFHSSGGYSYKNWFGQLVFAPIIGLLGVAALLAAIFNWRKIWDSPPAGHVGKGT
jgi:peptidoglycan/LPS O-acetylase OafA/YrhL